MKVNCTNCNATFNELEPKCPYCGSLNYKGADLEYHETLDELLGDLNELPEQQVDNYKESIVSSTKKTGKYLFISIIITTIVLIVVYAVFSKLNNRYDTDDVLDWRLENYVIVNQLYEDKKYDELVEFNNNITEKEYDQGFNLFDWEYYDFLSCYRGNIYSEEIIEYAGIEELSTDDLIILVEYHLEYLMYIEKNEEHTSELKLIETYLNQSKEYLMNKENLSDESIQEIYELAVDVEYDHISALSIDVYLSKRGE